MRQLALNLPTWGGRRRDAGRKRVAPRRCVPHRKRLELSSRYPVHVTIRLRRGLPTLRAKKVASLAARCLAEAAGRFGARFVHYSLQRDHLHLIVEADDAVALARGVKGLSIRLARALNRLAGASGLVVEDRYDARVLRTPLEVRRALVYVLQNARKHLGPGVAVGWLVDPFSSAMAFDGWSRPVAANVLARAPAEGIDSPPVSPPRTWLLARGWRRHGLVAPEERPAPG